MALFSARLLLLCQRPSSSLSLVSHKIVYKYNPILNTRGSIGNENPFMTLSHILL